MEDNSKTLFNSNRETFLMAKGEGSQLEVSFDLPIENCNDIILACTGLARGLQCMLAAEMKGERFSEIA